MKIRKINGGRQTTLTSGVFCILLFVFGALSSAEAQSTNQNFPTAITASEISGRIPARDVGDARLTSHFYTFNGEQGDVFINVVTSNLNGDIDVFTADNLRPLTKITIYTDAASGETGRVIYLRQPVKLVLRIEGRTPNDDPATYRIKFAGSFAPAVANEIVDAETPTVKTDNQTDVRVNSVGTIIEIKPKPTPAPKAPVAEVKLPKKTKQPKDKKEIPVNKTETGTPEKQPTATAENQTPNAVETPKTETPEAELPKSETTAPAQEATETVAPVEKTNVSPAAEKKITKTETVAKTSPVRTAKPKAVKPLPAAALENIRLILLFKDGTTIERPMNEVLKVGVDRGVLTVISKDGLIKRYSILDIEKMTIE